MKHEEIVRYVDKKIDQLNEKMDKMKVLDYMESMQSPWRLFIINFFSGVSRGFGMAVGFTILGAIVIYFLQKAVLLNIPLIGHFIAQIVSIVQKHLK